MATRAQAIERAKKLDTLARRTRHEGERRAARVALARLEARYGISLAEDVLLNGTAGDVDGLRRVAEQPRRWQAPRRGPAEPWSFDIHTGQASPNVKVHSYRDRANWRIEVPPGGVWDDSANRRAAVEAIRRRDPRLHPPK